MFWIFKGSVSTAQVVTEVMRSYDGHEEFYLPNTHSWVRHHQIVTQIFTSSFNRVTADLSKHNRFSFRKVAYSRYDVQVAVLKLEIAAYFKASPFHFHGDKEEKNKRRQKSGQRR
jgi:hypothetical protein